MDKVKPIEHGNTSGHLTVCYKHFLRIIRPLLHGNNPCSNVAKI